MDRNTLLMIAVCGLVLVAAAVIGLLIGRRRGKRAGGANVSSLASSLKSEQTKSEIILSAIEDGVVLLDNSWTIQLFNAAATTITGWQHDEAIGLNIHAVLQFVDEKGTLYDVGKNPFDRAAADMAPVRDNTAYLKTRSDKTISVSVSVSPLLNKDGQMEGAVGIFRDVSEERQEEKQRAEFISTASHEMRTPVAAIEGYLALALNEKVANIDSKARDYLEKAHASTQHLGKLFQDLLTAAKSEDGRLINHPTVVDASQFLQEVTSDVRFTAEKKGLQLEFLLGNDGGHTVNADSGGQKVIAPLYNIHVDPDRLREVITNLFDNAVKYTETGKITIGLTGDDKVVQIRVSDTGQGIPAEDIGHLFQKFYRVDNSATRTIGGTGLGLFICRKIVELYNGRIWVESKLGEGSTFYINLPRLSTEKVQEIRALEASQVPATVGAGPTAPAQTAAPAAAGATVQPTNGIAR